MRAIDFVASRVRKVEAAAAFYQDTVGVPDRSRSTTPPGTEFDTRPVTLAMGHWNEHPGIGAVALALHDVREVVAAWRGRHVRIVLAPVETDNSWLAIVGDPEGNIVSIPQRKNGTASEEYSSGRRGCPSKVMARGSRRHRIAAIGQRTRRRPGARHPTRLCALCLSPARAGTPRPRAPTVLVLYP